MADFSPLEDQIRECFGRVVYSHKTHEKMADGCKQTLDRYRLIQVCLSALTASGVAAAVFASSSTLKYANAALALLTAYVSTYTKSFDPGGSAQKHRDAASALWNVRESYLSLLTDVRSGVLEYEGIRKRRDELQRTLGAIYKGAPQTNSTAYGQAQKALKADEELTFSDAEIDVFLPKGLRKGEHGSPGK